MVSGVSGGSGPTHIQLEEVWRPALEEADGRFPAPCFKGLLFGESSADCALKPGNNRPPVPGLRCVMCDVWS